MTKKFFTLSILIVIILITFLLGCVYSQKQIIQLNQQLLETQALNFEQEARLEQLKTELLEKDSQLADFRAEHNKTVYEKNVLSNKLNLLEEIFLFRYRPSDLDFCRVILTADNKALPDDMIPLYEFPSRESEYVTFPRNTCLSIYSKAEIIDLGAGTEYWYCLNCPVNDLEDSFLWVPASCVLEYTSENMYTAIGPLQLTQAAVLYRDAECTLPAGEWYYDFYIIESIENGVSKIARQYDSDEYLYVYTDEIFFPEP